VILEDLHFYHESAEKSFFYEGIAQFAKLERSPLPLPATTEKSRGLDGSR